MANAEVECIVRDTRELMFQIGSGERRVDEMIRRVNAVNEKMACMKEYQNIMCAVNAFTVNGSRRAILLEELQRENRQILAYHEENRNLREAIKESMETLSIVMARHRNVMARMNRKLVCDLSGFMRGCEDTTSNDLQRLSQLLQENQVLREMLSTAAISTPGVKQTFFEVLTRLKAKREQKLTNGMLRDSEGDSGTDDELNRTVFEASEDRKQ
ncbi:hypothetical protein ANCDUO_15262 [Ancylostoma duodenale]|uniref:Uncharacterized protein n=1 Tax=Ancylostoma duodenale TaxID=51022 RepID=A0A0C2G0X6_9BILA|nr:hypothetical protein ANCDUO_15262 [Ancylostoma duodenale]